MDDTDKVRLLYDDAVAQGLAMLPPDVNESGYQFTVVGNKIRYGMGAIKGVGESAIESLLTARQRVGKFRSLAHLATEVDLRLVNRKVFECLIKAGGFDDLGIPRTPLWHSLDGLLDYAQRRRREREDGQSSLFGMPGGAQSNEPAPDLAVRPWPERERLRYEKEALGLFLSGNPLSEHQAALERQISHTTAALRESIENLPEGTVTLGGMVAGLTRVKIKSGANAGRLMGRFVLEDLVGSLAVTLFANQLQQFGHLISDEAVILVKGQARERGGEVEITVEEIVTLDTSRRLNGVDLSLDASVPQSKMLKLRDLLTEHPGDVPVTLEMKLAGRVERIAMGEKYRIQLNPELRSGIEGLFGPSSVRER